MWVASAHSDRTLEVAWNACRTLLVGVDMGCRRPRGFGMLDRILLVAGGLGATTKKSVGNPGWWGEGTYSMVS